MTADVRLSDADIPKAMELLKGVDSVELKVTVPLSDHNATIRALRLDPVEAEPRQVFFFDTPKLDLSKAGVVVRARRNQGGRGDTVVKLRPVDPVDLPEELRKVESLKVELDFVPGSFVCSASYKGRATNKEIRNAVAGDLPVHELFSKEQQVYYEKHAPAGLDLDSLRPLGPTFVLKEKLPAEELGRRLVWEMWLYPDGTRILELSAKCGPSEAFQVAAELRAYLADRGVKMGDNQETKTKTALEFFAAHLRARGPRRRRTGRK